jgi:cytochrome b6-f complex iron-sulfur subunit
MNRKEFLSLIGSSATSLALASCLGGCAKNVSSGTTAPSNVNFSLDLSQPANAALLTNGGYVYNSGVIVARTTAGAYIAVQQVCTHESVSVVYQATSHRFYCDGHGATFSESGAVTGGPAPAALKTYNTSLTGNMLRVYS